MSKVWLKFFGSFVEDLRKTLTSVSTHGFFKEHMSQIGSFPQVPRGESLEKPHSLFW